MKQHQHPLIFGEVLFDIFDNKTEKLGGAPFNVAWHLQGFGLNPVFVSSIGTDDRGKKIKAAMEEWGLSTIGVQRDTKHPTGQVSVTTDKNNHRFQIHDDVAYDYIDGDNFENALMTKDYSVLYHGTLALRHRLSRVALRMLKKLASSNVFLDVNLRSPWWSPVSILTELQAARWVKCNEEELYEIAKIAHIKKENLEDITFSVARKYGIETLFITRGDQGAFMIDTKGNIIKSPAAPVQKFADSVGAGDAFAAILILGLIKNWSFAECLNRANHFASRICEIQGAFPTVRSFYESFTNQWEFK